jgi:hypothetical protein
MHDCLPSTSLSSRLIGSGYSPKEILMATSDASRTRKERCDTVHQLRLKYQGMMMKANQLSPSANTQSSSSPRPQTVDVERRVGGGRGSGSGNVAFPNHYHQSRTAMSSPPLNDGTVIGDSKNWTPIRKKKHPGLYSPKDHSRGNNHLPMVQPKRHPLSPTNTLLPTPPRRPT